MMLYARKLYIIRIQPKSIVNEWEIFFPLFRRFLFMSKLAYTFTYFVCDVHMPQSHNMHVSDFFLNHTQLVVCSAWKWTKL